MKWSKAPLPALSSIAAISVISSILIGCHRHKPKPEDYYSEISVLAEDNATMHRVKDAVIAFAISNGFKKKIQDDEREKRGIAGFDAFNIDYSGLDPDDFIVDIFATNMTMNPDNCLFISVQLNKPDKAESERIIQQLGKSLTPYLKPGAELFDHGGCGKPVLTDDMTP